MPRITKEPEERRKEILDTAEELFLKNGYGNTAISDIVKTLGVAQGTFYYYFKSKDEILNAVLERYMDSLLKDGMEIIRKTGMNAKNKIEAVVRQLFVFSRDHAELVGYMHDKGNELVHYRIAQKYIEGFQPVMASLVRQGTDEGIFELEYSDEVVKVLIAGIMQYLHDDTDTFTDIVKLQDRMKVIQYILDRVLDVRGEGFNLI